MITFAPFLGVLHRIYRQKLERCRFHNALMDRPRQAAIHNYIYLQILRPNPCYIAEFHPKLGRLIVSLAMKANAKGPEEQVRFCYSWSDVWQRSAIFFKISEAPSIANRSASQRFRISSNSSSSLEDCCAKRNWFTQEAW